MKKKTKKTIKTVLVWTAVILSLVFKAWGIYGEYVGDFWFESITEALFGCEKQHFTLAFDAVTVVLVFGALEGRLGHIAVKLFAVLAMTVGYVQSSLLYWSTILCIRRNSFFGWEKPYFTLKSAITEAAKKYFEAGYPAIIPAILFIVLLCLGILVFRKLKRPLAMGAKAFLFAVADETESRRVAELSYDAVVFCFKNYLSNADIRTINERYAIIEAERERENAEKTKSENEKSESNE